MSGIFLIDVLSGTLHNYSYVEPASGKEDTMRNHFKTFMLLGTLSAIFIALGGLLGKSYLLAFNLASTRGLTDPKRLRKRPSNEGHGFSRAVKDCALDGFSR